MKEIAIGLCAVLTAAGACASPWFDAAVSTYDAWPADGSDRLVDGAGVWSGTAAATLESGALALASPDGPALAFTAAEGRTAADGAATFVTDVRFTVRAELEPPDPGAKGSVTALREPGGGLAYYGLAKDPAGGTNAWTRLEGATPDPARTVSLATVFEEVGGRSYVSYSVDGAALLSGGVHRLETAVADVPRTVAYAGVGRVASLAGVCGAEPPAVEITELMASNGDSEDSLRTRGGLAGIDWVEIRNAGDTAVDLAGWLMTDDLTKRTSKWKPIEGPAVVPAGGCLVVFADKDAVWDPADAHVAIGFSSAGEAVGLATPDGTVVSSFVFGQQFEDVSCGRRGGWSGEGEAPVVYFRTPTPGAANGAGTLHGMTPTVVLSEPHGYKTEPFTLTMSCPDAPDADIYFTTNGVSPSAGEPTAVRYTGPVTISGTVCVRAAVPDAESFLQLDTSATYLFVDDIVEQHPHIAPYGFPGNYEVNNQCIRLGFEPGLLATRREAVKESLTNRIATISMVIDPANLFNAATGIYVNVLEEGREWERPAMVEQIDPLDGANGFSVPAGVRIRGAGSRRAGWAKHSMRLLFRGEYGMSRLRFPLFGAEGADEFKRLDLRTSQTTSWANEASDRETFVTETFSRDSQRDMGQPYTRSRFFHFYINGVYWGLYETEERATSDYGESYFGGDAEDYDVVRTSNIPNKDPNHNWGMATYFTDVKEGDPAAWSNLWDAVVNHDCSSNDYYRRLLGLNPDGTRNPAYPVLVDPENIMVYMLTAHYGADRDSPSNGAMANNINGMRNRVDGKGSEDGFQFMRHDAECALGVWDWPEHYTSDDFEEDENYGETVDSTAFGTDLQSGVNALLTNCTPAELHYRLLANDEYRMANADLIYRECFRTNGAMTAERAEARYRGRMAEIDDAVVAESVRWGHDHFTRERHWLRACNRAIEFIRRRLPYLKAHYVARGWYPSVEPPAFLVDGAPLVDGAGTAAGAALAIAGDAPFYYTVDGSDPRAFGGAPAAGAALAEGTAALPLAPGVHTLKARSFSDGEWSALEFATVTVASAAADAIAANLRFAEFSGLPPEGVGDSGEYVVLTNLSAEVALPLAGVRVVIAKEGVDPSKAKCDFTVGDGVTVPPLGSVRLAQSDYGWEKITNNRVLLNLYNADGATLVQESAAEQKAFPTVYGAGGPGGGAVLVATSFDAHTGAGDWRASWELPAPPAGSNAVYAAILADAAKGAWLDSIVRGGADISGFAGDAASLAAQYLIGFDRLVDDPRVELKFGAIRVEDGEVVVDCALSALGAPWTGPVNGLVRIHRYRELGELSGEGDVLELDGRSFPMEGVRAAQPGDGGYRFYKLTIE